MSIQLSARRGALRAALAETLVLAPTLALIAAACKPTPSPQPPTVGATGAAAAAPAAPADSAAAPAPNGISVYTCPDGFRFSVRMRNDSAVVRLPASTVVLPIATSGSGARFEGQGVVFWSKGPEASLEMPGGSRAGCRQQVAATPWDEARLLGVEFRALGNEPGWALDIDEGEHIHYVGDYGKVTVHTPAPEPAVDTATGVVTYRARSGARELTVAIRDSACQDTMKGERFTHTVAVTLDGRTVRGCGRTLATTDVVGRHWRLASVGNTPAVTSPNATEAYLRMQSEGMRAFGSSGCNRLTGTFQLAGDSLRFGAMAMTRMACVDEAVNRQETALGQTFDQTRTAAVRGDTLVLMAGGQPLTRWVWVPLR